jgi:hypothetical protein
LQYGSKISEIFGKNFARNVAKTSRVGNSNIAYVFFVSISGLQGHCVTIQTAQPGA